MTGPILGVGELLFDCFPDGTRVPGGAPANFAFHCHRLGLPATVVSRVGIDESGDAMARWLQEHGLAADAVQRDPTHPTGLVAVALDAHGVPSYRISDRAAWDFFDFTDADAERCRSAAAIATGTLARRSGSRAAIEAAVEQCRGVRYFDINLREPNPDAAMLDAAFASATVAKLTDEELATLNETPGSLARRYPNLLAVVVTRGVNGAEWHGAAGRVAEVPGLAVEVIDTVGAGDAFGAVVVAGLLGGHAPAVILREANRYAAEVCRHAGATPRLSWRCAWAEAE